MIREVKEETGIDIKEPQLVGLVNFNLNTRAKELIFIYEVEYNSNVSNTIIK